MKNLLALIILVLSLTSCGKQDPKEKLDNVTGYWEIRKVEVSQDSILTYGMSEYVDYIEISDSTGFRKKLKPKFGGGYISVNKAEKVEPSIEEGKLFLHYSTPFHSWKEEVIEANEDELVVKGKDKKIYHYRKYTPITLDDYEEKKE